MYKVLLVDDEPLCIEGLKLIVDWADMGFELCGVCNDGQEAINKIKELSPHIVITDIKMPILDGLALIQQAQEFEVCKPVFIILSGYGEFEYAKKAMEFGIKHYILKPIIKDDIAEVLLQVRCLLDCDKRAEEIGKINRGSVITDIFYKILLGVQLKQDVEKLKELLPGHPEGSLWVYLHIRTKERSNNPEAFRWDDNEPDCVNNDGMYLLIQDRNNFGIVIKRDKNTDLRTEVDGVIEKFKAKYAGEFDSGISVGVGTEVACLEELRNSCIQACDAIAFQFFASEETVIFYEQIKNRSIEGWNDDIARVDLITNEIESLNQTEAERIINEAFDLFKSKLISPEIVRMYSINIFYRLYELTDSLAVNAGELKDKYKQYLTSSTIDIEEMRKLVLNYCRECCQHLKFIKESRSQSITARIDEYISRNFKRNITIKDMAKELFLHPVYLGQLIISKYGMPFNELINGRRINEACRLIETTEKPVSQIAMELGYGTYAGFLIQFEKRTGLKPTEYKRKY